LSTEIPKLAVCETKDPFLFIQSFSPTGTQAIEFFLFLLQFEKVGNPIIASNLKSRNAGDTKTYEVNANL